MNDLLKALDRSVAVEQIAEVLWDTYRGDSVLLWDELPQSSREDYRSKARLAVRSCLDYAVQVGVEEMASAMARRDGHEWPDLLSYPLTHRATQRARYRDRAWAAYNALRFHLAETAYPEAEERLLALRAQQHRGKTLGEKVTDGRVLAWRTS